jgi:endonuclease G
VNTIDEVERITSLDFFSALPDKVEQAIEATYDLDLWP